MHVSLSRCGRHMCQHASTNGAKRAPSIVADASVVVVKSRTSHSDSSQPVFRVNENTHIELTTFAVTVGARKSGAPLLRSPSVPAKVVELMKNDHTAAVTFFRGSLHCALTPRTCQCNFFCCFSALRSRSKQKQVPSIQ